MTPSVGGTTHRVVLRQTGAVLVPIAVWVFCFAATADAVIEGTPAYAVQVAVLMAAISFAVWLVLNSPCLVVETDGVRVLNPFQSHWVPFGALETVHVRGLVTLTARLASGRQGEVTSWNAPGAPRGRPFTSTPAASPSVELIERFQRTWERAHPTGQDSARVVTEWRWRPLLVLGVLLAVNISIWLR